MDDLQIIDLYWKRSEDAIQETDQKYGKFCYGLAMNVLGNREDAQECVSDTYLATWNALPPNRPAYLMAFLGKLSRRISIDRWRGLSARKRGGGQIDLCLDELADCASSGPSIEDAAVSKEACAALNRFLDQLPQEERTIFVRRYFLLDPIADISASFGYTEDKVRSMLHRTRNKLYSKLIKEGYL